MKHSKNVRMSISIPVELFELTLKVLRKKQDEGQYSSPNAIIGECLEIGLRNSHGSR